MNQKQLDRIEAMLEGLCMGQYCRIDYKDPTPKKKTRDKRRSEFASMIGAATYSYSSSGPITVKINTDGNGHMEATQTFQAESGSYEEASDVTE